MTSITVQLPDTQVAVLERVAHERGISIDAVVSDLVTAIAVQDATPKPYDVTQDPIYNIQAHDVTAPVDLAQNPDYYLYNDPI